MNSSGKVLIIFLVITAILLISLTAISLFFFQKETQRRKMAEVTVEEFENEKIKLEGELEEISKQNFLLQEKNKEADERVNDLTDELELEKGLREEMKLATVALEEKLEKLNEEKTTIQKANEEQEGTQAKLTKDLTTSQQKVKELEAQLKAEIERSQKLGQLYEQQKEQISKAKEEVKVKEEERVSKNNIPNEETIEDTAVLGVELEEIVVGSKELDTKKSSPKPVLEETTTSLKTALNGRILSVDMETEFVILSLGKKDGISVGNILSIYREEKYVGDIKITRLQTEMSAADLILPLSIKNVKKNDQVKPK